MLRFCAPPRKPACNAPTPPEAVALGVLLIGQAATSEKFRARTGWDKACPIQVFASSRAVSNQRTATHANAFVPVFCGRGGPELRSVAHCGTPVAHVRL